MKTNHTRKGRGVKPLAEEHQNAERKYQQATGLPKGQPAKKGYGGQHRRWDTVCSTCRGEFVIRGLSGYYPCPRCQPTTQEAAEQAEAERQERVRGVTKE